MSAGIAGGRKPEGARDPVGGPMTGRRAKEALGMHADSVMYAGAGVRA